MTSKLERRIEQILWNHGILSDDRVTAKAPPNSPAKIEAIIRDVKKANAEAEADE